MNNDSSKEMEQTDLKRYEKAFYVSDKDGAIQIGSKVANSVRLNFNGDMTDVVTGGDYTNVPYHKIITSNNISSQTVLNADTVDGKHAGEFVLKSGDTVAGNLKVNGIPMSETDVIRKKEMDSSLNQVNELLLGKAEKAHTHTVTEIGAETPAGAMDKVKVHNADLNAHKAILDKKVNLFGGELKDTVTTFNENTATEFPAVTSGGTLARILGDVKRNINSLVARVMGLSNPNLLINGDFQVWQRGENFPVTDGYIYTVDRWAKSANTEVKKTDYGLNLHLLENYNIFESFFENPEQLAGQTVTLSLKAKNANVDTNIIVYENDIDMHSVRILKNTEGIFSSTFRLSNNLHHLRLRFIERGELMVDVAWIKLELGSYATPFTPRSYGEELALCQRYYETINEHRLYLGNANYVTNTIEYSVSYKTTKRVTPNVVVYDTANNKNKVTVSNDGTWIDNTNYTTIIKEDAVTILANGDYKGILFSKIELDAEI